MSNIQTNTPNSNDNHYNHNDCNDHVAKKAIKRRRIIDSSDEEDVGVSSGYENSHSPEYEDYDCIADYYDLTRKPVGLEILKSKLKPTDVVLDAGCGTGNYLCAIYPYVKSVVPFEYNGSMLRRCLTKAKKQGFSLNLTFKGSLLRPLPLSNNTFDVIMNNQVIHHLDTGDDPSYPNLQKVLAEFYRILKPGGTLAINFT